jgi:hypothetical protein
MCSFRQLGYRLEQQSLRRYRLRHQVVPEARVAPEDLVVQPVRVAL